MGRTMSRTLRLARSSSSELEHVANVDEAGDLIDILFVNRDARVLLVDHHLAQFLERRVLADGDDARARRHHFAHGGIAERDHRLDQLAVAFFDDAFFFAGGDQGVDVFLGRGSFVGLRVVAEIEHRLQEVERPSQRPHQQRHQAKQRDQAAASPCPVLLR